jgi:hypothetical protein
MSSAPVRADLDENWIENGLNTDVVDAAVKNNDVSVRWVVAAGSELLQDRWIVVRRLRLALSLVSVADTDRRSRMRVHADGELAAIGNAGGELGPVEVSLPPSD